MTRWANNPDRRKGLWALELDLGEESDDGGTGNGQLRQVTPSFKSVSTCPPADRTSQGRGKNGAIFSNLSPPTLTSTSTRESVRPSVSRSDDDDGRLRWCAHYVHGASQVPSSGPSFTVLNWTSIHTPRDRTGRHPTAREIDEDQSRASLETLVGHDQLRSLVVADSHQTGSVGLDESSWIPTDRVDRRRSSKCPMGARRSRLLLAGQPLPLKHLPSPGEVNGWWLDKV